MQNEACIKQGSEKESFRQQLNTAMQLIADLIKLTGFFDDTEMDAIRQIYFAADEKRMSPKAFLKAVEAAVKLREKKDLVLSCGYTAAEYSTSDYARDLYDAVKAYTVARAEVLGFQKSITPSGWDILED